MNGPLRAAGKVKGALYFDGIDDHVTVADSNSLDVSSSFTLSAWVNPASSFTDFRSILVKNYKYYLYASVAGYCGIGNPIAGFHEQTTHTVCQPSPLPANTWTHLAATYTGSTLTLYRNGTAVATSNITKALSSTTGTLQIGASQFGENFKGLIDEVRVHNRALTNTEIQALFQQEAAVRESGLVAHWKFDEGNGTTASDSSGSGNTGILTNGPLWSDGRIGKGLYFDGIDDHVTVTDSNSLDVSSSFTLSAWVNPASAFTDFRSILVKNYKYYLYASVAGHCGNGSPLAGFDQDTSNNVCQLSPLPTNTWTHLAATYNGSILTLYRNGVAVATSNIAKALSATTGTLQIGASQFGENFKGLIDEVRIHNRALTPTQIQAIFHQESGEIAPSSAPVVSAPATGSLFTYSLANSGDKSVVAGSSMTNSIAASLGSANSQLISFSVSGVPSGATASFSSTSCSPTCSSTLTINAGASTPPGSSTITVTATGGGVTKTTTFSLTVSSLTVATPIIKPAGVIRYADGALIGNCASGNYSIANRNCTGSDGNAYGGVNGVQNASNAAAAGDTILIRSFSGVYTGSAEHNNIATKKGLSVSQQTRYEGYQDERPRIKGFNDANFGFFKNLILDGENLPNGYGFFGMSFSRAENIEIKDQGSHGILFMANSQLINADVHHNGWNSPEGETCPPNPNGAQCHGVYTGGGGVNNLFDGGRYYDNSGYGIHCYTSCSNTVIRNLRADHNVGSGVLMVHNGSASGSQIYNVVADNNGGSGVQIGANAVVASNISTYNNVGGGVLSMGQDNHTLRNCLCLDGVAERDIDPTDGGFIEFTNNITSGSVLSYFVDAANGNFQLISTSPVGADLSSFSY